VVLDVGAHIGIFSRYILKRFPDAQIYAVEPDVDNFELLGMNVSPFRNVQCFQQGFLDKKDRLKFYRSRRLDWRSTFLVKKSFLDKEFFEPDEFETSYEVDVETIDDFTGRLGFEWLDMLKITIPGEVEPLVLAGAKKTIETFRPHLTVSVYPENLDAVIGFMNGFSNYGRTHRISGSKAFTLSFTPHERCDDGVKAVVTGSVDAVVEEHPCGLS
jgi:FkbM family methyltransferase